MIKLNGENGKLEITCPYNRAFIDQIKGIGGKWDGNKKVWIVAEDQKGEAEEILHAVYNYEPAAKEIKVKYYADHFAKDGSVIIGSFVAAKRFSRDSRVVLYNTIVLEGTLKDSGGSAKYPEICADDDVIFQTTIPEYVYTALSEEDKERIEIVPEKDPKEELLREKETLLARLAQIEKELNN